MELQRLLLADEPARVSHSGRRLRLAAERALEAKLGIPFSVDYRPTSSLRLTANYMPLDNVQVRLQQEPGDGWSVYGGYRTLSETFFLSDRLVDRERTISSING